MALILGRYEAGIVVLIKRVWGRYNLYPNAYLYPCPYSQYLSNTYFFKFLTLIHIPIGASFIDFKKVHIFLAALVLPEYERNGQSVTLPPLYSSNKTMPNFTSYQNMNALKS